MASSPPTLSDLLAQVSALLGRRDLLLQQEQAWAAGTATGGPNGDGNYPIADSTGFVRNIPSPAKLAALAGVSAVTLLTRAALAATTVPAAALAVETSGYANPGDGGAARYYRVASQPAHAGKVQDASGAWFELRSVTVTAAQFGAFPDGADQTARLQDAVDYLGTRVFGGKLALDQGTYRANDLILRSQVELAGAGMLSTTIAAAPTAPARAMVVFAAGSSKITVDNLTIDGLSATTDSVGIALLNMADFVADVEIHHVRFANGRNRWALRNGPITGSGATYKNLNIHHNRWVNCPSGGILVQAVAVGNSNIRINDNWWDQVGGNLCQISDAHARVVDDGPVNAANCHVDVQFNRNRITNCLNTGSAGPIPAELWGCTGVEQCDNFIDSGTRGLTGGAGMIDGVIARNIILNQTAYACEAGASANVEFVDNIMVNCNTMITFTGTSSTGPVTNYTIARNKFYGTGRTSYNSSNPANVIGVGNTGSEGVLLDGVYIYENELHGCDYVRNPIQVWYATGSKMYVERNKIFQDTAYSSMRGISSRFVGSGDGHKILHIKGNTIIRTADVPADHYMASAVSAEFISLTAMSTDPAAAPFDGLVCEGNILEQWGNYTTNTQLVGIGDFTGSRPRYSAVIRGNTVRGKFQRGGIYWLDSTGTAKVVDNDVEGLTAGPPYTLDASTVFKRTLQFVEGTAPPATGAWRDGAICWNGSPTVAGAEYWQYSAAIGTWIARFAPGLDPVIPGSYTLLSSLVTSPRLTLMGQSSGSGGNPPVLKLRAEASDGQQLQLARFTVKWVARRNNDAPYSGTIDLSYAGYSNNNSARFPLVTHSESSTAPTISTALDGNGKIETTITFGMTPSGTGGVVVEIDAISSFGTGVTAFSGFSAMLA